jgi:uncharacterized protein (DUF1015 family)
MAEIKSFRALRYNQEIIKNLSNVIAPPYDVISKDQQEELYSLDEHNVIKIDLNKASGDDKYKIAKETFEDWQEREVLIEEEEDSLYPYYQRFTYKGEEHERVGLIGLVRLQEFADKIILPHEETFSGPKADRLKLMRACNANLSPIFGVYNDSNLKIHNIISNFINSNKPIIEARSLDKIINKVWKISDKDLINKIQDAFSDKQILIADGHHRYETSLNLKREQETTKNCHAMFYLSGSNQEGLLINPTHRVLNNVQNIDKIISSIKSNFLTESLESIKEDELLSDEFFVVSESKDFYKCKIVNEDKRKFYGMSVYAVQNKIIDVFDGTYSDIGFFKSIDDARPSMINNSIGLILPKFVPEDIMKVVLDNNKMPQKSTYFYPKIATGLLFNKLY